MTIKVTHRPVSELFPYAGNARTHDDAQVGQIAASIAEFGFVNPILAGSDGVVIAGHGRLAAAKRLGLAKVPVIVLDHLSEAQRRALVIADNRIAENAGWDEDTLKAELDALRDVDFDLDLLGFDDDELAEMFAAIDGEAIEEAAEEPPPEPPVDPASQLGDLWVCGRHRVICGDATSADVVSRVLGDVKPHLMVTDPPYGVEYDAGWRLRQGLNKAHQTRAEGKVENDDRADWREAWALFPGEVAYVWHSALHSVSVAESLLACGFALRSQIIWSKPSLVIGRGDYHWQHEPCWYAVRKTGKGHWAGDRKQSTIWSIPNMHRTQGDVDDGKTIHSTQMPIECMRRPILNNSSVGQAVYEPFMGSGSTLMAAELTGRACLGVELNPAYVDVIVQRWQNATQKDAVLEGDGRTFAEVSSARKSGDGPAVARVKAERKSKAKAR